MKKLIILLVIFLFSCGEKNPPQEIEWIVELFSCDGTVIKTYEAVKIVKLNPELKIELIDGTEIYTINAWIATKQK